MWYELMDAQWFNMHGMYDSFENVKKHYEKLNINPYYSLKLYELASVRFEKAFYIYINNDFDFHHRFILFDTNELVVHLFMFRQLRIFYSDNAREFLFNLKMICDLTIHSYPEILELANYINFDMYYFDKCINKN